MNKNKNKKNLDLVKKDINYFYEIIYEIFYGDIQEQQEICNYVINNGLVNVISKKKNIVLKH